MLLPGRFRLALDQFFIAASLALPQGKHRVRIACALIDRALGRNDFSTTAGTCTSSRSSFLNVDVQQLVLVFHFALSLLI